MKLTIIKEKISSSILSKKVLVEKPFSVVQ